MIRRRNGRKKHYDRTGCDSKSKSNSTTRGASGTREQEEDSFLVPLGARDSQTEPAQVEFQQSCWTTRGLFGQKRPAKPHSCGKQSLDGTTHSVNVKRQKIMWLGGFYHPIHTICRTHLIGLVPNRLNFLNDCVQSGRGGCGNYSC